jgi:hypothetical protein
MESKTKFYYEKSAIKTIYRVSLGCFVALRVFGFGLHLRASSGKGRGLMFRLVINIHRKQKQNNSSAQIHLKKFRA